MWYDAFIEWNKVMNQERAKLYEQLVKSVMRLGYPREFGQQIAGNLRTEKAMSRMIGYLSHFKKISAEEIADEMIAIMEERQMWMNKKAAEYYNGKYNEMLYRRFNNDDE